MSSEPAVVKPRFINSLTLKFMYALLKLRSVLTKAFKPSEEVKVEKLPRPTLTFSDLENSLVNLIIGSASEAYKRFSHSESAVVRAYGTFTRYVAGLQAVMEDALAVMSLYVNFLLVASLLMMVFYAWILPH